MVDMVGVELIAGGVLGVIGCAHALQRGLTCRKSIDSVTHLADKTQGASAEDLLRFAEQIVAIARENERGHSA
jgi:hypothetical protein